jgi:hypothetical protein
MATNADNIVGRYLGQLGDELDTLAGQRRHEVMEKVAGRIAAAREQLTTETDADVLEILERIGHPAVIAAIARERFGVRSERSTWREVAAIVLLPFGGVIVPLAGWLVGVFFLWASEAWTRRDKLIGTLIVPGGLLAPLLLFSIGATARGRHCSGIVHGPMTCTGDPGPDVLVIVGLAALLAAPLGAALYLALRLRTRRPATFARP